MKRIIKNGLLADPYTGRQQKADLLINEAGRIEAIAPDLATPPDAQVLEAAGCLVTPGLVDSHVHFRDPAPAPLKETLHSGALAAARGGYATVVCMANTNPPTDTADKVAALVERARQEAVEVLICGNATMAMAGKELCDYAAMKRAGAVGVTDDGVFISSPYVLMQALQAAREQGLPLSLHEEDPALVFSPGVNSGPAARRLGLRGAMAAAEVSAVFRDVGINTQCGGVMNIQHVSCGDSLAAIRLAKSLGMPVFAEATPHHLTMTEAAVERYGTLAKMNPPLRTERDRQALVQAVAQGDIDIIATDHAPHTGEEKARPFDRAPSGIIGLESAFAVCYTRLVREGQLALMDLLRAMCVGPARLYGLTEGRSLTVGNPARLAVFDPEAPWDAKRRYSLSENCPFYDWELMGETRYTLVGSTLAYDYTERDSHE